MRPPLSQAGYTLPPDEGKVECAAVLESAMLVAWEAATESSKAMESYLRRAAKEGAVQKLSLIHI